MVTEELGRYEPSPAPLDVKRVPEYIQRELRRIGGLIQEYGEKVDTLQTSISAASNALSVSTGLTLVSSGGLWVVELDRGATYTFSGQVIYQAGSLKLESAAAPAYAEGLVFYDSAEKALAYYNDDSNLTIHAGQDSVFLARNATGSTIPKGTPVYSDGATGNRPNIIPAQANALNTARVAGVVMADIANNADGYVMAIGVLSGLNTSAYTAGDELFLDPTTAGSITVAKPSGANYAVIIGECLVSNPAVGEIKVHLRPTAASAQKDVPQRISATWCFGANVFIAGKLGVGPGAGTPDHYIHVIDNVTADSFNEIMHLEWISPSPLAGDNMDIVFTLANSLGQSIQYGKIRYQAQDITNGAENGAIYFNVIRAGALEQVLIMDTDEIIWNDSGADRNLIMKGSTGTLFNLRGNGTPALSISVSTVFSQTTTFLAGVSLNSTLAVTGATSLNSTLAVTGAASLNSTLAVAGAASLNSTLLVNGVATFDNVLSLRTSANPTLQHDVATGFTSDWTFYYNGTLTALIRWQPTTNVLEFYDRDPSPVLTGQFDFDTGDFQCDGYMWASGEQKNAIVAGNLGSPTMPFGTSTDLDVGITAQSVTAGDQVGFYAYMQDGTRQWRCFFGLHDNDAWGMLMTGASIAANTPFKIMVAAASLLEADYQGAVRLYYNNSTKLATTNTGVQVTGHVELGSSGPTWTAGSGSPEGVVTAPVGSLYSRTDGGAATSLYVKESGTGNTGWVGK